MSAAPNWTKVLAKCSPSVRKTILETRGHHEDLRRQIAEFHQTLPKLDFDAYRRTLPQTMRKVVDDAEAQFRAFKPKKIDATKALSALDQERDLKLKLSQEFIVNLESKVDKLKSQLHKLETAKPIDELTVDDVYEINPELRDKVHQMIREDHWAVSQESEKKESAPTGKSSAAESGKEQLNYL